MLAGSWSLRSKSKVIGTIEINPDLLEMTFIRFWKSDDLEGSYLQVKKRSLKTDTIEYKGYCENWGNCYGIKYKVLVSLKLNSDNNDELSGSIEASSNEDEGPRDAFGGFIEFMGTRIK